MVLEVAQDNGVAIALYRRAGFQVVGRRPNYYRRGGISIDADIMRLDPIGKSPVTRSQ
jgi:ribosomal-protein-alanine N-acetyltransferase